jgi:hypothetical protein
MDLRLPSVDPFMFFTILALLKDAVCGLRNETRIRDRRPDPRVRPRTGTVERRGYGPSICIRVRILYRTARGRFSFSMAQR